jgi:uncharacterized protein (TIGR03435 family)
VECQPAKEFIQMAYMRFADGQPHGLPVEQLSSQIDRAPAWLNSERFTISASVQSGASREMMMGPMMQRLLEDRFKLKIRHVIKEGAVYALTVAGDGAKLGDAEKIHCSGRDPKDAGKPLKPGEPPRCPFDMTTDMSGFTILLRPWLDRPVIDRTGIGGTSSSV